MVHSTRLLTASRQHGWRFEKLRPTFKKWVRINHPPQVRSLLLKLDPESNKLLYVCNGRISPRHCATYEKAAKHFIKKGEVLETPVLAIVKGGSHVLLETLCMDDVEQLEKLVPEIRKAFDGGCETVVGGLSRGAARMLSQRARNVDHGHTATNRAQSARNKRRKWKTRIIGQ